MGIDISYMGSKRDLAPHVRTIIAQCAKGPLLDLFAGICFVSRAIAPARQIWTNDTQQFASLVAAALFSSTRLARSGYYANIAQPFYEANFNALKERFRKELTGEREAYEGGRLREIRRFERNLPYVSTSEALDLERRRLATQPATFPYRLFSITFPGSYFALSQCLAIDSIRFAIDRSYRFQAIDNDDRRWMLLALGQAASKTATTTGHFAQHLSINGNNRTRYVAKRSRAVWDEWLSSLSGLAPLGNEGWRSKNRTFNREAIGLLRQLRTEKTTPAVVYADPPYTDDQYSRFYHLLETLLKYNYPVANSAGRYPAGRFHSAFSHKTKVEGAFHRLVDGVAKLGAEFVLSYPEKGLFDKSLVTLLRKKFKKVEIAERLDYQHSSLGASKGFEKHAVAELIYYAR